MRSRNWLAGLESTATHSLSFRVLGDVVGLMNVGDPQLSCPVGAKVPLLTVTVVRCAGPVEPQPGVVHLAAAVEGHRRVAARVVGAARQVLDARDEGAQVSRVRRGTAPSGTAVVGEIGARVPVTQRAARRPGDRARPGPGHVVVRAADDPVGVVRVDRDRGLVLRGRRGVLVHVDRRRRHRRCVQRARQHLPRGDRRCRCRAAVRGLFLDERREPNLQPRRATQRRHLPRQRGEVIPGRRGSLRGQRGEDRRHEQGHRHQQRGTSHWILLDCRFGSPYRRGAKPFSF